MPVLLQDVIFSSFKLFESRQDDDLIDRFNYFFTPNLLIALAILVSFKQFGGKPIECLVPDIFTEPMEQYTEQYCWAENTYYLSLKNRTVPFNRVLLAKDARVSYYQWVPFFLLIQAFCFLIPSVVWKMFSGQSGIKVNNIVQLAIDAENVKKDHKEHTLKILTSHLENALRFHRRLDKMNLVPHTIVRPLNLPYKACYITIVYVFVKILYALNVIGQFYWLNDFLQSDKYTSYGLGLMSDLLNGRSWEDTGAFPRVTLCDFKDRAMGSNVLNYTIQCVMIINLFTEKIFIALYFWYFLLMALTLFSLLYWSFTLVLPWPSRWFVTRHMELSDMKDFCPIKHAKKVERFVSSYLHMDGVFVLRMIMMHTGVIFGTELTLSLWNSFYNLESKVIDRWTTHHMGPNSQEVEKTKNTLLDIKRRKMGDGEFQGLLDRERDLVDSGFVEIMPTAPSADVDGQQTVQKQVSFAPPGDESPPDRRKSDL